MKLIEISKAGNLYFQMSDGRMGMIYPKSGYVRVKNGYQRPYQINKVANEEQRKDTELSRVLVFSVAEQFKMLLNYNTKNCIKKQSNMTRLEWYNQQTEELLAKFKKCCNTLNDETQYFEKWVNNNFSMDLGRAFEFALAEERHDYWIDISNKSMAAQKIDSLQS